MSNAAFEYGDLLFAEADKWIREVEKSNWVPVPQPSLSPDPLAVLASATDSYKESGRQYRAALLAFSRLREQLEQSKRICAELQSKHFPTESTDENSSPKETAKQEVELLLDEEFLSESAVQTSISTDYMNVFNSLASLREKKIEAARAFLQALEKARISGALKNERLTKRLTRCEADFEQLSEDYDSLLTKYNKLVEEKGFRDGHVNPSYQPPKPPSH
jgi:chromosome segregation ATPase